MKKIYTSLVASLLIGGAFIGCASSSSNLTVNKSLELNKLATYKSMKKGGSEIVAFDKYSNKIFTTNGATNSIDILAFDKKSLKKIDSIDLSKYGSGVNSVAVKNTKVAVAIERVSPLDDSKQLSGYVLVFTTKGKLIKKIKTGFLPDMVTFNEDGSKILVANEGEPNKDYSYDPKGSIGIIDIEDSYEYTDLNFFDKQLDGQVVIKKGVNPAFDLEPEYITVSKNKAYVALQENNAIAIVNLDDKKIEKIKALGFKDHSKEENSLDIEEEGKILLKAYKNLYGMYQPDSIDSYIVDGKTYIVSANEGDGREYGNYENETKIKKLKLSNELKDVYKNENDLKINNELGKKDGVYNELYTFGARSFSIWDEDLNLVFDSKNELAKLAIKYEKDLFNHDKGKMDKRSGNKGVEPEALTIGKVDGKTYAFVGLERQSAIVVYDITNPKEASFVKYLNTKDENISPEGMKFVKAENSPTKKPLLIVAFEVSGTTSIYELN